MRKLLANIQIILAVMVLTLVLVDRVNHAMQFVDYIGTKWLIFLLCLVSIWNAFGSVRGILRAEDRRRRAQGGRH